MTYFTGRGPWLSPQPLPPDPLLNIKQEYIPVGCVPAARRLYVGVCFRGGGGVWSGGSLSQKGCLLPGGMALVVSGLGGVCSQGGWCLVWVVVSGPGGSLSRGVSTPGGVVPGLGGWCLVQGDLCPGGVVSQHALRQTPSPL